VIEFGENLKRNGKLYAAIFNNYKSTLHWEWIGNCASR